MYWIEIIGTFAFAISGIRLAAAKQFDLFGLFIVGFVTAVGGGTIRAHDRFLIIDDKVYHIGASLKDLGKKWFAFSLMQDITPQDLISRI